MPLFFIEVKFSFDQILLKYLRTFIYYFTQSMNLVDLLKFYRTGNSPSFYLFRLCVCVSAFLFDDLFALFEINPRVASTF